MDLKRFKIFVASLIFSSTNVFLQMKINAYYIKIHKNCQENLLFDPILDHMLFLKGLKESRIQVGVTILDCRFEIVDLKI